MGGRKKVVVRSSIDPKWRFALRHMVRAFDDAQRMRMAAGGRVRASVEAELDPIDVERMGAYEERFLAVEEEIKKDVVAHLRGVKIWEEWLSPHVKGVAEVLASYLLGGINIENCHTPSQLWSWCGVGQAKEAACDWCGHKTWTTKDRCPAVIGDTRTRSDDGEEMGETEKAEVDGAEEEEEAPSFLAEEVDLAAAKRRAAVKVEVVPAKGAKVNGTKGKSKAWQMVAGKRVKVPDGAVVRVMGSGERVRVVVLCNGPLSFTGVWGIQRRIRGELHPYNHELKMKILGRIGTSLMRAKGYYYRAYIDHRNRLDGEYPDMRPGRKHRRAIRFICKTFLADLWRRWRTSEGLSVRPSYQEEYLGHEPSTKWLGPEHEAESAYMEAEAGVE